MQCACAVLYCHQWPVWPYRIFPHYLINGRILEEKSLNIKRLSETFLTLRITQPDTTVKLQTAACKEPVIIASF